MTQASVLDTAIAFAEAGISVVPAALDGSKRPLGTWKHWQAHRMAPAELHSIFGGGHAGIGVVTGAISGGLEMLELEGRAVTEGLLDELTALTAAAGLRQVWEQIVTGYCEATPSGGLHILYRVTGGPVRPNTKLARRPATGAELQRSPQDKIRVLIETRGEGGFTVTAPSAGRVHPTGRPWRLLSGSPASIATITAAQRGQLHQLAATFDQIPRPEPAAPFTQPAAAAAAAGSGLSPGDDYEQRTGWEDILKPEGWQLVYTRGTTRYWRRPGKSAGISATTGQASDRDRLYVFTTSTPFDPDVPYTKLGALAVLAHGGDHHAAARALSAAGYGRPAAASPRPAQPPAQAAPAAAAAAEAEPPGRYGLNDDSLALRLADTWHETIRYCPQRSKWLTWNGNRWLWDDAGHVAELTRAIARGLPAGDKPSRAHRQHALSGPGLRYAAAIATTDPRLVVHLRQLDADPYILNTPAGPVNLRTGQLLTPDPARLCAKSATVAPDFTTPPARWLRFLADTFAGDPDLTSYVQRLLGLSLVGLVIEQILPFCYGEGQNGKSTLLDVVKKLAGDYAIAIPVSVLLASRADGHPTEIAQLAGVRLAITSEPNKGQRFDEARIKLLTGGDEISARFMHGDFFDFTPAHTIWITGNHTPEVRTGGPAFWRRLRLLPFLHRVPDDQKIENLDQVLIDAEGPAILAWLISGAAAYFTGGITEPDSVKTATADYQASQDTVGRFAEECCDTGPPGQQGMNVKGTALYIAYEAWCRSEGEEPESRKSFSVTLRSRFGVISEPSRDGRWYSGIRLTAAPPEERDGSRDGSGGDPSQPGQLGWR